MTGPDPCAVMRALIEQAHPYRGLAAPNPVVAAAVVRDGEWVAAGVHKRAGGDHAEVVALKRAGDKAVGATLYVTLEPCTHWGKTPPCCSAIIAAGIAHVVWAVDDPSPHVRRQPAESVLQAAGIGVTRGILADDARLLNPAFHRADPAAPFITVKLAQSLDGKLALDNGDSAYLTSDSARRYVHQIRNAVDAIVVGAETVWTDNPALTIRHGIASTREPAVIVASRDPRTPKRLRNMRLFAANRPVYVTTLTESGIETVQRVDAQGQWGPEVALTSVLPAPQLLVEGGATIADQMLQAGVVDELLVMVAPCILGGSQYWGGFQSPESLMTRQCLAHTQVHQFDDTVMIQGLT